MPSPTTSPVCTRPANPRRPAIRSLPLKFAAKLHGETPPIGPVTQRVLTGIRRTGRSRGRGQVQGVNWQQADAAVAFAETGGSLADARDAAIIAVASDAMLRVSELAALQVDDITYVEPEGTGLVTVRSSKTDQEGRGAVQFLGASTAKRIKAWLAKAGIRNGPLFRRVFVGGSRVGDKKMNVDSVRRIIKERCAAIGIDKVSGHSLRVGGAQSLAGGGATVPEMQAAGRWESPQMPGHYARGQLAARGAVARIKYPQEGGAK